MIALGGFLGVLQGRVERKAGKDLIRAGRSTRGTRRIVGKGARGPHGLALAAAVGTPESLPGEMGFAYAVGILMPAECPLERLPPCFPSKERNRRASTRHLRSSWATRRRLPPEYLPESSFPGGGGEVISESFNFSFS